MTTEKNDDKRERLVPYGEFNPPAGCRNCAYRHHEKNRIASICSYDGLELNTEDVFAKACMYWKKGSVA